MTPDHFDAGIRHLEIGFAKILDKNRRAVYYQHLRDIPNDLWDTGILKIARQTLFPSFPLIAQIGEACIPGQAETEEIDPWTGRWKKISTPWLDRLAKLTQPVISPPPFQIPGPRDPLSAPGEKLLWQPDFKGLLQSLEGKIQKLKEIRAIARKVDTAGSPYSLAENGKKLLDIYSEESQVVIEYWTPERKEEQQEFLHRQLMWLTRRGEAERNEQEFVEEKPSQ